MYVTGMIFNVCDSLPDWPDCSVGKRTSHQAWPLDVNPKDPHGRRKEQNPAGCPLDSIYMLYTPPHTHTHTKKLNKTKPKPKHSETELSMRIRANDYVSMHKYSSIS